MRPDAFRALGFILLIAALLVVGAVLLPRILDAAGGAEAQVAAELKGTEPEGLVVEVPGSPTPARSRRHAYSRVTFRSLPTEHRVEVSAALDFTGVWGAVEVSSLGLEKVILEERDGRWQPLGGWAPSLGAVLARLEARRKALEAGDISALTGLVSPSDRAGALAAPPLRELLALRSKRYRVRSWYLRFERGEVQVTEEGMVSGDSADRPVQDRVLRRLRLVGEGREFFFSPSLM